MIIRLHKWTPSSNNLINEFTTIRKRKHNNGRNKTEISENNSKEVEKKLHEKRNNK